MEEDDSDPVMDKGIFAGRQMSTLPLNILIWLYKITLNPPDSWKKHIDRRKQEKQYDGRKD